MINGANEPEAAVELSLPSLPPDVGFELRRIDVGDPEDHTFKRLTALIPANAATVAALKGVLDSYSLRWGYIPVDLLLISKVQNDALAEDLRQHYDAKLPPNLWLTTLLGFDVIVGSQD